jgi:hypothetical protein
MVILSTMLSILFKSDEPLKVAGIGIIITLFAAIAWAMNK